MLKSIIRLLGGGNPRPQATPTKSAARLSTDPAKPARPGVPVYPPVDHGILFGKADAVLATQADMIRRLKLLAGLPAPDFDRLYGDVQPSCKGGITLIWA